MPQPLTDQPLAGLHYFDTSAILPLAVEKLEQVAQPRATAVRTFVGRMGAVGATAGTSVLALEEIAFKVRRDARHDVLAQQGHKTWRDFERADPKLAEAESEVIQAQVLDMVKAAIDTCGPLAIQFLQPTSVVAPAPWGKQWRKNWGALVQAHREIDPMDALHVVTGSALSATAFVSFDKAWAQIGTIKLFLGR